jgi:hypothetical protein
VVGSGVPEETPENREAIYDNEIAPLLLRVAELCKAHGMPMVAAVYYDGESSGMTRVPPEGSNPAWLLVHAAWLSRGNIDAMCIGLARSIKPENDGSIVLRQFRPRGE